MILYPKIYLNSVKDITISLLKENKLEGLILDVDNTLIDYNHELVKGLEEWANEMKKEKIQLCIVSNSNNKKKVEKVANMLGIPYIYFAKKPLKFGFKKAIKILGLTVKEIGVVGDQIFTDVVGANRCKMFSILVKPVNEKDIFFVTRIVRKIESKIIKKYIKHKKMQ